jgi:hypothetical protein
MVQVEVVVQALLAVLVGQLVLMALVVQVEVVEVVEQKEPLVLLVVRDLVVPLELLERVV